VNIVEFCGYGRAVEEPGSRRFIEIREVVAAADGFVGISGGDPLPHYPGFPLFYRREIVCGSYDAVSTVVACWVGSNGDRVHACLEGNSTK